MLYNGNEDAKHGYRLLYLVLIFLSIDDVRLIKMSDIKYH